MASTLPSHSPLPIPVVAIVVDSSITLASEWHHILHAYFPHLLGRLAGGTPASLAHLRLGFVTYGPPGYDGSPLFINRFFTLGAINELKEDPIKLAIGRTVTRGSIGMAALEGYAAAIEMFDTLKSGINQRPLRPLNLNEARDKPKEEFTCHLWHFAARQPDDAKHPFWNSSPALDSLTWATVPSELKRRDINCSMLLVNPSPKFLDLFSAISDAPVTPWFPTRSNHTVLLSGFAPSPKPKAAVPSTIPAKRPADTPAEQRSPGPKIAKAPSQTASPALAAAKKPFSQSSPLVPPAAIPAPPLPSSSQASPTLNSSPPKPPPRQPQDSGVIDLTHPTPELAPTTVQNRSQPPKPNPQPQAPPTLPNPAPTPQPAQPLTAPPTQSQPPTPSQPQLPPSMQSQLQTPSQFPFALNIRQLAGADVPDLQAKLKQVETRIMEMRKKQVEAAQAGRTEEESKLNLILSQQVTLYKKGYEFVARVMQVKKAMATAQAQGSLHPHEPAPDPGTSQYPTPAVAATPVATTPTTSHSTPRLATPRKPGIPVNQDSMSAASQSSPNSNPVSVPSAGPGLAVNPNAALLPAFNPTPPQIQPQGGLGSVPAPDVHVLSGTPGPQLGHPRNNNVGQQQPPQVTLGDAAQMKLVEHRLAQGNQGLIASGNGAGTNAGAGPSTVGGIGERMDLRWTGILKWQGTDTMRNERKEVHAQVTAIATKGNPLATTWPSTLSLAPAGPAVSMDELQDWVKKTSPVITRIQPAPGTDDHSYGQLVKLLRDKNYYAIAGWEIEGLGRSTMNLLIAPLAQGFLLGAVFPTTGMTDIPKSRLPQLDPAMRQKIMNSIPQLRSLSEPQLSQAIMHFLRQRQQALQGGGIPLPNPNAAANSQQQQQSPQPHQLQHQPQHQQQQQSMDRFPQNPGINMPSTASMFGNMGLKQGELNPFVPGSQANAIASGLLVQTTSLQQLQRQQQQQQQAAHAQQQHQAQQRAMQLALGGGLGAGVGAGLGGALMNTGGPSGGLGGMSGGLGQMGVAGGSNGLGVGGFRNGGGPGLGLPVTGASFEGLSAGTGLDGGGGSGAGGGVGMGGMHPGTGGGVTLDMYQSFLHRSSEGAQGQ